VEIKSLCEIISGKEHDCENVEFLSNGALDIDEDLVVPKPIIEWCEALKEHTASCLYLVRTGERYGVMAVNEYDGVTMETLYSDDREAMQAGMRRDAEALSRLDCAKDFQVFWGAGTACMGYDEICVLIPFETSHEKACALLKEIDANVYFRQTDKS